MKNLAELKALSEVELNAELVAGSHNFAKERLKTDAERSRDSFCLRKHRRYIARIKTLLSMMAKNKEA